MTDKEILKKILQKAKENGLYLAKLWCLCDNEWWIDNKEKIIFSHDFAKAFWGELPLKNNKIITDLYTKGMISQEDYFKFKIMSWQYHLQQMVILPDNEKLKYLEKFL